MSEDGKAKAVGAIKVIAGAGIIAALALAALDQRKRSTEKFDPDALYQCRFERVGQSYSATGEELNKTTTLVVVHSPEGREIGLRREDIFYCAEVANE